jgi:mRNA-degrading endonuclease toxin of MazEF toxin-antitoxin module
VFADEQGAKRRPVLILSGDEYREGRQEVIVAAITSNLERLLPGDLLLDDWQAAGLPRQSVVTGILRTIKRAMIERTIGRIGVRDLSAYENLLRWILVL